MSCLIVSDIHKHSHTYKLNLFTVGKSHGNRSPHKRLAMLYTDLAILCKLKRVLNFKKADNASYLINFYKSSQTKLIYVCTQDTSHFVTLKFDIQCVWPHTLIIALIMETSDDKLLARGEGTL